MNSTKSIAINNSAEFTHKPLHSKIKLTQSSSCLLFYIPPKGLSISSIFSIITVASVTLPTALFLIQLLISPTPFNSFFVIFCIPFLVMGCFQAYITLFDLCSKTHLKIENQTIEYTKKFLGIKINVQKPIVQTEIKKLVFTRQYSCHDRYGKPQENPATLQIYAGSKKIILGGITSEIKSEAEIAWMAHVISDGLDIPLDILDYSSPASSEAEYSSPRSSDLKFTQLLVEKPSQTKISLIKRPDLLSIYLPPYGYHPQLLRSIPIYIITGGVIGFIAWALLYSLFNLPKSSLLPTTVVCSLLFTLCCAFECLLLLFGKRYIRADRQSINYISMLFGIRVSRHRMIFRNNIKSLTLVRKNWWLDDSIDNLPTLKIDEGSKQISIGAGIVKREDEVTWLAAEISDWLSIPINIVDPNVIDRNLDINNN
jgi:hypothetical protein